MQSQHLSGGGLDGKDLLAAHGGGNNDGDVLTGLEVLLDLVGELRIRGEGDILALLVLVIEEGEVAVGTNVHNGVVLGLDEGSLNVGGGGGLLLALLAGEDINGGDGSLGGTVLAGLGDGDLDDLAGVAVHDEVLALLKSAGGDGEGVDTVALGRHVLLVRHVVYALGKKG